MQSGLHQPGFARGNRGKGVARRFRRVIHVVDSTSIGLVALADFLGHSTNAIRWQVWTSLLVYVLLRFLAFRGLHSERRGPRMGRHGRSGSPCSCQNALLCGFVVFRIFVMARAEDWLAQARNDLDWGLTSMESGFYSQACFIAQQVAEKALKAVAYHRGAELIKGHSVLAVCRELGINGTLEEQARLLDQFYIPTRYPDAQPAGAPFQYFSRDQAEKALAFARNFLAAAQRSLGGSDQ